MIPHPDLDKFREFVDAFEEVFDRDWPYTKVMLGIKDVTPEQKVAGAELGLEPISIISDEGTFIRPDVEDEIDNWGNRAKLLTAYRAIREEML